MEFSLTSRNINKKFKWETTLNLAFNRNKVLDAAGLPPDAFESGQPLVKATSLKDILSDRHSW